MSNYIINHLRELDLPNKNYVRAKPVLGCRKTAARSSHLQLPRNVARWPRSAGNRIARQVGLQENEVLNLDQFEANAALEALIVLLLQVDVVLVQLQLVLNLADFLEVPRHHDSGDSLLVVVHLLNDVAALRVDPLKLRILPRLFSKRQPVFIQGDALDLKDLVIFERDSEVVGLELIDALLDVQLEDVGLDGRDELPFRLLLGLHLDVQPYVFYLLANLVWLSD